MKRALSTLLVILILVLSACTSQASVDTANQPAAAPTAVSNQAAATAVITEAAPTPAAEEAATEEAEAQASTAGTTLNTDYENAVSLQLQLLLGTLSLRGTDLAVTEEQAAVLLPLWTTYQTLSSSMMPTPGGPDSTPQSTDTDTQAEIEAVVADIQAAMTSEQLAAITEMQITQETAMTIMEELGITMGGSQPGGGGMPPDGQAPQGTPPDGGGAMPPGGGEPPQGTPPADGEMPQGTPPADMGTPPADGGPQGTSPDGGGMVPPQVIDMLIQWLAETSGDTSAAAGAAAQNMPEGTPGGASLQLPGGASGGDSSSDYTITAVYTQDGGSETKSGERYAATNTDESAVYVINGGDLTLSDATITSSGDTSSSDASSFYGLNAAVLAASGGSITLSDSTISTSGSGANGAFATGAGSSVVLSNVTITATGGGGHGVMATNGGSITLTDVNMNTSGKNSGVIATDRGSGTINVTGGIVTASGQDSPGIYSTGIIVVTGATITATGAEAAVIEGANSINLTDTDLSSSKENKWGVMIYQSMSGDAEGTRGVFTMKGGSLAYTAASGPLFYVTNSTGVITLKGVTVIASSGTLISAAGNDRWGPSGSNGGTVIFTADGQTMAGNMTADAISSLTLTLQNGSKLTGAINAEQTAKAADLTLDGASTWNVTADSHLTCLNNAEGISGTKITNITGNGHTVTYDASSCSTLSGKSYTLTGGGYLQPAD